jgi:delta 1-pyrroline-5-carboxylate dehydrogenase
MHSGIAMPVAMFGKERKNSKGLDLSNEKRWLKSPRILKRWLLSLSTPNHCC